VYESTTTYFDVAHETASIIADEIAAANSRTLNYVKGLWNIAGMPQSESPLRTAFERAEAVVDLTARSIEESLRSNLEVTEKLLEQSKKLQQHGYESVREISDKGLGNVKSIVDSVGDRIENLTERVKTTASAAVQNARGSAKANAANN
jgi:hypothetical protein